MLEAGSGLDDALRAVQRRDATDFMIAVSDDAIQQVKFSECLPRDLAAKSLAARLADTESVAAVLAEPIRHVSLGSRPSA